MAAHLRGILRTAVGLAVLACASRAAAWDVVAGKPDFEIIPRLVQTTDGRLFLITRHGEEYADFDSTWLAEISPTGDVINGWSFGSWPPTTFNPYERPSAAATPAGGLVVASPEAEEADGWKTDIVVLWFDAGMRLERTARLAMPTSDEAVTDVAVTTDGGVVVTATTRPSTTQTDGLIAKLDAGGNMVWAVRTTASGWPVLALPGPSGNALVITGHTLAQYDGTGTIVQQQRLQGTFNPTDASLLPDGSVLISGFGGPVGPYDSIAAVRIDPALGIVWQVALGSLYTVPSGRERSVGSCPTAAGGAILASLTDNRVSSGANDAVVVEVDPTGTVLWQRQIDGSVTLASDVLTDFTGIVVGGEDTTPDDWQGAWVAHLDATGIPDDACISSVASAFRAVSPGFTMQPGTLVATPETVSTALAVSPVCEDLGTWTSTGGDVHEFQDGCPPSSVLRVGETQHRNFCDDAVDDVRLEVRAAESVTIETGALGALADTVLEIVGDDCTTVLASDDDGAGGRASRVTWVAPSDGSVSVRVRQADGSHGPDREYDLTLTSGTDAFDRWMRVFTVDAFPSAYRAAALPDGVALSDSKRLAKVALDGTVRWCLDFLPSLGLGTSLGGLAADGAGGVVVTAGSDVLDLDVDGNVTWKERSSASAFATACPAASGGVILSGTTLSAPSVTRLAADGSVAWTTRIPLSQASAGWITETGGGDIVVFGATYYRGPDAGAPYAARLDAAGNLRWVAIIRTLPGATGQLGPQGVFPVDGDAVVLCLSLSENAPWARFSLGERAFLMRLDASEGIGWARELRGTGYLHVTNGRFRLGEAVVSGYGQCGGVGGADAFTVTLTPTGDVERAFAYDLAQGTPRPYGMDATPDGRLVLAGMIDAVAYSSMETSWLALVAPDGSVGTPCPRVVPATMRTTDWVPTVDDAGITAGPGTSILSTSAVDPVFVTITLDPDVCAGAAPPPPPPPREVSPPGSAFPLLFTSHVDMTWEPASFNGADTFNVYRGDLPILRSFDYGSCWQTGLTSTAAVEPSDPGRGACWFYLVTARNAVAEGPMGSSSTGRPRTAPVPCP